MWAVVSGREILYVARALPFSFGGKRYAGDASKFKDLLPVRRTQANAPEDTTGWSSASSYEVKRGFVLETVIWVEDEDAVEKRAERDLQAGIRLMRQKRDFLLQWMAENDYYSDAELGAAELLVFEAWYSVRIGEEV